mmetsp:Transcript_7413/g.14594  ORF Transcript_7413/g.14594 Transcript_7413/m.14594 type:complete len:233 (+) Transcript_7413:22-720(+)
MKYLELSNLQRINSFLENADVGEYVIHGDLEAYSCKLAGFDKKLSRSLEQDVQIGTSPLELAASPVGPLSESSSRKTLVYLILTLNQVYPDYDFRSLRANNFLKEPGISKIEETIDSRLLGLSKVWSNTPGQSDTPFLENLWSAIDEAIEMNNCDVYSYKTDLETDPFGEEASIWSFNYFFYNKKMKRILYFSCRAVSKLGNDNGSEVSSTYEYNTDSEEDEKYGMATEMDV